MSHSQFGSYAFGTFTKNEKENERLKAQAQFAWQLEKSILKNAGITSGSKVLDIACGQGFTSFHIASDLVGETGEVLGIELNELFLEQAKNLKKSYLGQAQLNYQKGNVYALDGVAENYYDFAYARFLFQHLDDPQKALNAIKKCLKPGGRLIITDVDDGLFSMYPEPERLQEFLKNAIHFQEEQGGDRLIGRKLGWMLKKANYNNISINTQILSTEQIPIDIFIEITTAFKVLIYPEERQQDASEIVSELLQYLKNTPESIAFNGVYIASGDK